MSHRRLAPAAAASFAVLVAASAALAQDPSASPASASDPGATTPAAPDITVVGIEYAFTGLPTSVPAGTSFGFDNQGAELHQLLVVRKNEGVTETWDELLAMPDEESNSKVTLVGHLIVGPGKASPDTFTVEQEGDYFAVCLIPQGTTHDPTVSFDPMATADPAAAQASGEPVGGVPHAFLGMRQEFTVTAAGETDEPDAGARVEPAQVAERLLTQLRDEDYAAAYQTLSTGQAREVAANELDLMTKVQSADLLVREWSLEEPTSFSVDDQSQVEVSGTVTFDDGGTGRVRIVMQALGLQADPWRIHEFDLTRD